MKTVCIYCGSNHGIDPAYHEAARDVGRLCAARGISIVYGGGGVGLMGTAADAALKAGGEVIGVIPRLLVEKEKEHRGLTRLFEVETMHERKQKMADLADAFVALPGGIGTLEEVVEMFTWQQLGYHHKNVALLNVHGFFDPLISFLRRMVGDGFLKQENFDALLVSDDPGTLLEQLSVHAPSFSDKWL